ncbi:hypothetical protein B8V81_1921 [Paenibacillus pasadenensis]|uniref:Uncharacterized protein n=1 Tax=Paenibacillus pasadenensis TaxID=217090 RepID=A0A2N5NBG4_9BACL|nr:hypothetical protein B8V81_1921 [Paenibacillus pasadenensis]
MDSFYQSGFRPVKAGSRAASRPDGRRRGRRGRGAAAPGRGRRRQGHGRGRRRQGQGRGRRAKAWAGRGASGAGPAAWRGHGRGRQAKARDGRAGAAAASGISARSSRLRCTRSCGCAHDFSRGASAAQAQCGHGGRAPARRQSPRRRQR